MSKIYAVQKGRQTGLFFSWDECEKQVRGYSGAKYKSFKSIDEAQRYLNQNDQGNKSDSMTIAQKEGLKEGMPYVFVDGSFNVTTGRYGYGGFLNYFDKETNQRKEIVLQGSSLDDMSSMQNIAGEISGAMAGVRTALALGLKNLIVYYDNTGIEMWAIGDWDRTKTGTKAYHAFMQDAMKQIDIRFVKVKAHSGIEGNERADKLAKEAVGLR